MGYHTRKIDKGVHGQLSKIQEEYEEFLDANLQKNKIMELQELSDIIGAIEAYVIEQYGGKINLMDVLNMKNATQSAFLTGERVSRDPVILGWERAQLM